jgi:hypothetical protein
MEKIGQENVESSHLNQDMDQLLAFVNTVMSFQVTTSLFCYIFTVSR